MSESGSVRFQLRWQENGIEAFLFIFAYKSLGV